MRGTRFSMLAVASLTMVIALGGCAGSKWRFWETSQPAEPTAAPAVARESWVPTAAPAAPAPATPSATAEKTSAKSAIRTTEILEFPAVRFRSGQVSVGKADAVALDGVARWLKENPAAVVVIEGHTDDLGTPSENMAVGEKRAVSIKQYLLAKGIESTRMSIVSYGSDHPVCWEKTTECRAKNRRADLVVKRP
jgi:outer membrane protein OmpA-like peptidoglycan-associated protein